MPAQPATPTEPRLELAVAQLFMGPSIGAWHACWRTVLRHEGVTVQPPGMLRARLAAFPHAHAGARPFTPQLSSGEPAQVFAALAQGLQRAYRHHAPWHRITATDAHSSEIVLEIMHPECSLPLMQLALALTQAAFGLPGAPGWDASLWRTLRDLWPRPSYFNQQDRLLAARQMGLHCEVGAGIHRAQYMVGQGPWRRLMANAYTASTSHVGKDLSGNKVRARTALARAGLPVPAQCRVASAEEAVHEASRMGYPVVLKPSGSRASQGVYTMLTGPEAIGRVFPLIEEEHGDLIMEKQVVGQDYRLLVVGSRCIAAARRLHPTVTGDGQRTIAELSAAANVELGRDGIFNVPVTMDPETLQALRDQDMAPDSIPPQGQTVVLRKAACPASLAEDVTHLMHPSLARMAEQAAAAVQLDMAGIDLVCPDITQPWQGTGTAIVEINAGPAVDINSFPDLGAPQPVARAMLRTAIPAGQHGNIPVVAVVGRYHKQQGARHLCQTLRMAGLDAQTPDALDAPFPTALPPYQGLVRAWAGAWLARDGIEALVLPLPWSVLAREGLPVAQHAVAVFTDDDGAFQTLGDELQTPALRQRLYRLVVDASLCGVVFPAASQALSAAVAHLPACSRLPLIGMDPPGEVPDGLAEHCAQGGEVMAWSPAADQPRTLHWRDSQGQWHVLADLSHAPAVPPGQAPDGLVTLAASLAALRLLGYDGASLQRAAALHTGHAAHAAPPPHAAWALHAPSVPTEETAHWLRTIAAWHHGPCRVHCHDTPPERTHLARWLPLLPTAPLLWHVEPEAQAPAPPHPGLRAQLLDHGVPPTLIGAVTDSTAAGLPCIHLDDLRTAPLLRGWAEQQASAPHQALLWRPEELPTMATAAWVGGPPAAHRACTALALDPAMAGPGVLVIIAGRADSVEGTAAIEQRTRHAIAQGAWAVMSAVMPPELPRWHPVLLCDDPMAGLLALACRARQRYQGRLAGLLTDAPSPHAPWHTALALAQIPGPAATANVPLDWSLDTWLLARPDDIVLPHATPELAQRLRPLLPFAAGATITVVQPPDADPAPWHDLVRTGHLRPDQLRFAAPLQPPPTP